MLSRRCATPAALLSALVLVPQAAAAAPPPVNCPPNPNAPCITRVEKPPTAGATRRSARSVSASPPVGGIAGLAAAGGTRTTPAQAAQVAVSVLRLRGPRIGIAPNPDGAGLVGLPVWLWTVQTPLTWGPVEQTTAVTGLAVLTRAQAVQITWDMGDGDQVVCANPGTPYQASFGNRASPTCGYRYQKSSRSQPGGVYTVTGTTLWQVTWQIVGGGGNGVIPATAQTQTTITVDELQVVTQ